MSNAASPTGFNPDLAISDLVINGSAVSADVTAAISQAQLERVLIGASTLTLTLEDPARTLINSEFGQILAPTAPDQGLAPNAPYVPTSCAITDPSTGDQLLFALCSIEKQGDQLQLVFEDYVINALRYCFSPGGYYTAGLTRAEFMVQVIHKALTGIGVFGVTTVTVPPTFPGIETLETDTGDSMWGTSSEPHEDAWSCLVRLANSVGWRCFSTGSAIVIGPDEWLLSFPAAASLFENTGGVDSIDFTCDMNQAEARATIHANTQLVQCAPGDPIRVANLGIGLPNSVDMSQLIPGDLIFYNMNEQAGVPGPGHVVMYIGNGQVVEAYATGTKIRVDQTIPLGAVGARRPAP